jgi:hypothetical protein
MARHPFRLALSLALGILITIGGCSEPASTVVADSDRPVRWETRGGSPSFAKVPGGEEVSALIGPEGGTLHIPGGHTLVFPAGAVTEPTRITARPGAVFLEIDFGPDGSQFPAGREPQLTMGYGSAVNLTDESSLKVAYMVGNKVVEVVGGQVDTEAKTVTASIKHFSKYCLIGH